MRCEAIHEQWMTIISNCYRELILITLKWLHSLAVNHLKGGTGESPPTTKNPHDVYH